MTDDCPKCRLPVIRSPAGDLEATPSQFGTRKPDGTKLTGAEHAYGIHTGRPRGHMPHQCPPPKPNPTLF